MGRNTRWNGCEREGLLVALVALAGCRRDRLARQKPGFWSSVKVFLPRKRPFFSLKTGFLNFSDKLLVAQVAQRITTDGEKARRGFLWTR